MEKMLLALDAKLLGWAEWVVKKWNWWTGKDQFCLARITAILGAFLFLFLFLVLPIENNRRDFLVIVFIVFFYLAFLFLMIRLLELREISDSLRGVKSGDPFFEALTRPCFLFLAIFTSLSGCFAPGRAEGFCIAEMFVFSMICIYFVEVPTPPFKRSQALEALGNFFATPALVPVSSH